MSTEKTVDALSLLSHFSFPDVCFSRFWRETEISTPFHALAREKGEKQRERERVLIDIKQGAKCDRLHVRLELVNESREVSRGPATNGSEEV